MKKFVLVCLAATALVFGTAEGFAKGGHGGHGGRGHHAGQSQPTHGGQDGCSLLIKCKK